MKRFLDFQFQKEVKLLPLSLNQSFRAIATSLLYLFSTIYVYKIFFSLTGQVKTALLGLFVYSLTMHVSKLVTNLVAEEWSLKFGLKKQIYLGLLFLVFCSLALMGAADKPLLLVVAAVFWGMAIGFYWFGRHGLMAKIGRSDAFGKELGIVNGINTLFLLGTPFLGGLLINFAGYRTLFLVSLFFVLLAALAIRPLKEEKTHYDTSLTEVLNLFRTHKKMVLAYIGHSARGVICTMVWPLYLFLILKKELSLGEFFSLSMILVALLDLLIGRWVDLRGKKAPLVYGSLFQSLTLMGRALTSKVSVLFIFDIIDRITGGMVGIPLSVLSYEKAINGYSTGRATLFREIAITLGDICGDCFLILVILLGGGFGTIFFLAAFASLSPLLIVKKHG